jgi:hypothetical protein
MKNHVFDADGTISLLPQTRLASHQQICSMKKSGLTPGLGPQQDSGPAAGPKAAPTSRLS